MAVFKINKTKNYTIMSNNHFKEKNMSLKAKGLLSLMLSLPEDWDYSISGLVAICKENETAIVSTLKELKEFGYLRVDKLMPNQTKSGRIEYVYNIFEYPQEKQEGEKQPLENLCLEKQPIENKGQYNTKNKDTNKLITNNIIYSEICDYLNEKAKTNYRPTTKNTISAINARLNENYTLEDFKTVIDKKCDEWLGTEMEKYLTPDTLFRPSNFEKYLNQKIVKKSCGFETHKYSKAEINNVFDDIEDVEI